MPRSESDPLEVKDTWGRSCDGETDGPAERHDSETEEEKRVNESLKTLAVPEGCRPLPVDPNFHGREFLLYHYKGQVISNLHILSGCMDLWTGFKPRDSDIIVATFPKSGTTWLQEIIWRIVHKQTGPYSGDTPLEYRFPLLDMCSIGNMQMQPMEDMPSPRLMKSHLAFHLLPGNMASSGAKILYVSRDARDVCVSFYFFSRMLKFHRYRGTFQQFRQAFQKGAIVYGPYREHVKSYLDHSDTVFCVTYEQLHDDRPRVVAQIARFLGREVSDEDVENIAHYTSFEAMKNNPACNFKHWDEVGMACRKEKGTFMRNGKVGDWRNYFSEKESAAFMKWRNGDE